MVLQATRLDVKTYDDLRAMPDDGNRYELIHGEIVMSPSPKVKHQQIVTELIRCLGNFMTESPLGLVLAAPMDVVLSSYLVLQPDIMFVSSGRFEIVGEDSINGSPDLVVEVLSESTRQRDVGVKALLYAEHGVREHWVIDPDTDGISIFVLEGDRLVPLSADDEVARSRVIPGFTVEPGEFFASLRIPEIGRN